MATFSDYQLVLPFGFAVLIYSIYWLLKYGSRADNLPPGPPTLPILGNLNIFPKSHLHFMFTEWAKEYGDVFSLKVLNQTIIVLNTPSAVKEIIERRNVSSSNRPKSILADMITPHNMNLGTGRFANSTWKVLRKASSQLLSNENIKKMGPYQHAEATQLMWELSHTPDKWYRHIQRFTTSFALGIIYGTRGPTLSSPDVADFLEVHPQFLNALELGTLPPVDLFPILTLLPERWAHWKKVVKQVRRLHETLYDRLLRTVEKRLEKGQGSGVFMENAIQNAQAWGLNERDLLMHLGGVLLEGSDTTSAALQNVILALVTFPDVQKKAREEIDRVVGSDRAPTWKDIPNLPYTMAIIEECNRFRPVGPVGLPHEMVKDEIVDGVLYPKDAIIFLNSWAIFHDARYYDRPDDFIPERFLKHPLGKKEGVEDDPARRINLLFGGGRRVCPGIAFALSSLEINIANFIWGFEFLPAVDLSTGRDVFPSMDNYNSGITAAPKPVQIRIVTRSQAHKDIIDQQFSAAAELLAPCEGELKSEDKEFNRVHRDRD